MKKYLAFSLLPLTMALTACGGDSDSGTHTTTITQPTSGTAVTPITPTTPSVLQINNPSIGQTLTFGIGTLNSTTLVDKKYYARYAYCIDSSCAEIRLGEMNFTIQQNGNDLQLANVNVDMLGKVTFDNNSLPIYQNLSAGAISLATSSLTLVDATTNHYKLKLAPALHTDKLPDSVDIDVYLNGDGMHITGADDNYLFVAQQMATAPAGWMQTVDKSAVTGNWKAFETDANLKVISN